MNEDKLLCQLQEIFKKKQKMAFIPKHQLKTFENSVITSYASATVGQLIVNVDQNNSFPVAFLTPVMLNQLDLYKLAHEDLSKPATVALDLRSLSKLPVKEMITPLRSMGSSFVLLPKALSKYQIARISQLETCFTYTSAYIIRNAWGKNLCQPPKIDNKLKPILNAWSEPWFRILKLCINCRDFLSESEQKRTLKSWDWLDAITQEHRKSIFLYVMSDEAEESCDKGTIVAEMRDSVEILEDYGNPVDPLIEPSFHRLLEVSSRLAEISNVFRDDFWRPYIHSVRNWAIAAEESPYVIAVWSNKGQTKREQRGK